MAITEFQRGICRLIAQNRVKQGDRYVARDIDLFHDTREALAATWDADRSVLLAHQYNVDVRRERPTFVEAVVTRGKDAVVLEWVCDSAYRFFPLVEHPDFGLALHPFDLATNKVLALVGRLEVRDWVDTIACSDRLQHLGYLAWAACGKDPGYGPSFLLAEARRTARYSASEVAALAFDEQAPDAAELSLRWATILGEASSLIDALPAREVGKCILSSDGGLFQGSAEDAADALRAGGLVFHAGTIRGAMPSFLPADPRS